MNDHGSAFGETGGQNVHCAHCFRTLGVGQNAGKGAGCAFCAPRRSPGPSPRPGGGKISIHPPSQYVSPDLESPQGPLDFCYKDVDAMLQQCMPTKPAWDMDTLKRAICSARTGTGEVQRIIESCTFKPREQAFTALINMCGQLRDWRKAVEVFEAMKHVRGVRPNTYTYSALIAACSSAGEWQRALEFFGLMKIAAKNDPNCQPNEVTYSALITACERGGQFERALEVYDDMVAAGVAGDHITFSSALSACEKSRNWVRAEKILQEMHAKGLSGNAGIYSEMMLNYAENEDWEKALDMCLTMQMAGQDPNEGSRRRRVRNQQRNRPMDIQHEHPKSFQPRRPNYSPVQDLDAQRTGSPFHAQPGVPSTKPAWDMETLKRAICFAKPGTGEVRRVIEGCTFRPREQAFTALINMCGRLRDWRKAMEVFEAMKFIRGVRANTYTYSALIAACSSSGEWEKALEIFEMMKVSAGNDRSCQPNEVTYSALITACQRGGMFDRALELYDEMMTNGVKADQITFSSVLAACEKSERWDRVEEILNDMHSRGMTGTPSIYCELIGHHAETGDWSKALDVFLTMQMAGQEPDTATVKALIVALERGGQYQRVLELVGGLRDSGLALDPEVYNCMVRVSAAAAASSDGTTNRTGSPLMQNTVWPLGYGPSPTSQGRFHSASPRQEWAPVVASPRTPLSSRPAVIKGSIWSTGSSAGFYSTQSVLPQNLAMVPPGKGGGVDELVLKCSNLHFGEGLLKN